MPSHLPKAMTSTKLHYLWPLTGVGLLLVIVLAAGMVLSGKLFGKSPFTGPTYTVRMEKLKVALVERGALESANNGDILCTVRSGTKGSTIATTIKWVIDPGVEVKKGDKLMELDSSGLRGAAQRSEHQSRHRQGQLGHCERAVSHSRESKRKRYRGCQKRARSGETRSDEIH